jgi:hypothetical protein
VVEFLDVSNMTRYKLHHALSNVLSFSNELFIGCTSCHLAKKKSKRRKKKVPCHRTKSVVKYITHTSSKTMHTHLGPSSSSELAWRCREDPKYYEFSSRLNAGLLLLEPHCMIGERWYACRQLAF